MSLANVLSTPKSNKGSPFRNKLISTEEEKKGDEPGMFEMIMSNEKVASGLDYFSKMITD